MPDLDCPNCKALAHFAPNKLASGTPNAPHVFQASCQSCGFVVLLYANDEQCEDVSDIFPKGQVVEDPQTGERYVLETEGRLAGFAAGFVTLYLLATLGFLGWLLFDTWAGRNFLVERAGYSEDVVTSDTYRLFVFVAIAGALGGTIAGIRSVVHWHAKYKAYSPRFIWNDLARPWVGATLGTLVYVAIRGGVGVINGDFTLGEASGIAVVAAVALAAVAGFGSPQVYKWLDDRANRLLNVKSDKVSQIVYAPGKSSDQGGASVKPPIDNGPAGDAG